MPENSKRIKVKSLTFTSPPFRKLQNLQIHFADRLTLIAGHNGLGKSTILGLVANTFGFTAQDSYKTYFGDAYYANIERIVYLDLSEVGGVPPASAPVVTSEVGTVTVRKRCALTKRAQWKRARVVPRTIDKEDGDDVGQDAKVPLPTIFLGMKRLASPGEAGESELVSSVLAMHDDDRRMLSEFVVAVIPASQLTDGVTHESIKGSKKRTAQPGYQHHDAKAVSVGQDSVASIATALASFNRLKREMGDDYPGGLLIIDEMDVGFHPHAVDRLAKALKNFAVRLSLQIIATTHSPRLIEVVHPEGGGDPRAPDSVVYLLDTRRPRLAEDQSLDAILADMAQREDDPPATARKPVLCAYFEDLQAAQFCEALIPPARRRELGRANGVTLKFIPLGVGGSHLVALPSKDPLFKDRVLVVDGDTSVPESARKRGNTVKLPCPNGAAGTARSPENSIKNFIRQIVNATDGPMAAVLHRFGVQNPTTDRLHNIFLSSPGSDSTKRESTKAWWIAHWKKLDQWGVVREWALEHQVEVDEFHTAFEAAVRKTALRVRGQGLAKAK